jgi:hypothetical protein
MGLFRRCGAGGETRRRTGDPGRIGRAAEVDFINDGVRWPLRDVLVDGAHARLDHVPADPWGNAYVVLRVHDGCWKILSAGPDGVLDTTLSTPEESAGDDVGGWIVR